MTLAGHLRDGRVLFVESNARLGFLGLLPGETKERDLSGLEWSYFPHPVRGREDGRSSREQGEAGGPGYSVYLRKLDGSAPVRLGEGNAAGAFPGRKWVLTALVRSTPTQIVLLPTGAGEPKTFPKDQIEHVSGRFGAFLPDGKRILFDGHEPGRPPRSLRTGPRGRSGEARHARRASWRSAPLAGRQVARDPRRRGWPSRRSEGGPSRPIAGLKPGDKPLRFTAGRPALFLRADDKRSSPRRVFRLDVATGRREVWKELMPGDPAGITRLSPRATSPRTGRRSSSFTRASLSDLYLAEGLK